MNLIKCLCAVIVSFAMNEEALQGAKHEFISVDITTCEEDDFSRLICIAPPSSLSFVEYRLQISQDFSKLVIKDEMNEALLKPRSLVDIVPAAKVDLESIYWVVSRSSQSFSRLKSIIYREHYSNDIGEHSRVSVVKLANKKTCLVALYLSERLGPEVDLLENAKRAATNSQNAECL